MTSQYSNQLSYALSLVFYYPQKNLQKKISAINNFFIKLDAFTRLRFYAATLLRGNDFTRQRFYVATLLRVYAFTRRRFCLTEEATES